MNKNLCSIFALALDAAPAFTALGAEPKRVIVVTVTTGFRHGNSIPFAEKTIKRLGEESKAYTVVDMVQQPATPFLVSSPAPKKPGDLAPTADDAASVSGNATA